MNNLQEIKEKTAKDNHFQSWEEYASTFPIESTDKLAIACLNNGYKEGWEAGDKFAFNPNRTLNVLL